MMYPILIHLDTFLGACKNVNFLLNVDMKGFTWATWVHSMIWIPPPPTSPPPLTPTPLTPTPPQGPSVSGVSSPPLILRHKTASLPLSHMEPPNFP